MALSSYISACRALLAELRGSLSEEDLEELFDFCARARRSGWQRWCAIYASDICDYVEKTPSARAKLKKWSDPALRQKLTLAAMQHIHQGMLLLETVDHSGFRPGGSYRSMAAFAGLAYEDLLVDKKVVEWPFNGGSPFDV
ncbi:MAG: hypothetical protein SCI25_15585 [Desulfuromonadales bacterium]|nr:hypothetical protein [Desulfuromonadales bacterium]